MAGSVVQVTVAAVDLATVVREVPVEAGSASIRLVLLSVTITTLENADGVTITTDEGLSVELNGVFEDADGATVSGSVDLALAPVTTAAGLAALPPAGSGIDALMGADVRFQQGDEPVEFDGTARLRWLLPPDLSEHDVNESALRFYDEETQDWVEGGEMFIVDGVVTAAVDHFTTIQSRSVLICLRRVTLATPRWTRTATITPTSWTPTFKPGAATTSSRRLSQTASRKGR